MDSRSWSENDSSFRWYHCTLAALEWFAMSTTGKRMANVGRDGRRWVDMKERESRIVAAHL
jgi:hypothetical protein